MTNSYDVTDIRTVIEPTHGRLSRAAGRRPQTADRRPLLTFFLSIAVFLAIAVMATIPSKSQAWSLTGTGNGSPCSPPGDATWFGYLGIRTAAPATTMHLHSGYCLATGVYDPAIARIQSQVASYGFGQSSIQFWSGLQGTQDWQVASIKPITNATPTVFNTANYLSPANWNGGLAFYCSGTGQLPITDGAEVMRLYDQRVAVNSTTATGRFDVRVAWGDYHPRFVFSTSDEWDIGTALKMYCFYDLGSEFDDAYPIWNVVEPYAPDDLGISQYHILSRSSALGLGQEDRTDMLERLTVTGNGNVGIGQVAPDAKFQVTDGSVLFEGTEGEVPKKWTFDTYTQNWYSTQFGSGTRLMWIPEKAAFRAGKVNSNQWNDDYYGTETPTPLLHKPIGFGSTALGENVKSEGNYSMTVGLDCESEGLHAVAIGNENRVYTLPDVFSGNHANTVHSSFALGHHSIITGSYDCLAMGYYTRIKNFSLRSVAMGRNITIDEAEDSFIFGSGQNQTDESYSLSNYQKPRTFMVGFNTKKPALFVSGGEEEAISEVVTNVQQTSKVGIGTSIPNNRLDVNGAVVIGSHANGYAGSAIAPNNGLLVEGDVIIGALLSGSDSTMTNSYHTALYVNGSAAKPGGSAWRVLSDKNLKNDISSFSDGLDVLKQINPVRFHYNGKFGLNTNEEYIGVIAQDMQKIAPYTISTDTLRSRKAITTSGYVKTEEIDTTDGENRKKLRYVPAEIQEEANPVLSYDATAIQYITINAVKQLDSTVSKLEKQFQSINTSTQGFAKVNDSYTALEQRIRDLEDKILQIQTTCCNNLNLYEEVLLEQNSPNPFSKETIITYYIPSRLSGRIELIVSDISGNTIFHSVPAQSNIPSQYTYSSTALNTGVYLYGISINGQIVKSKKMMLIK